MSARGAARGARAVGALVIALSACVLGARGARADAIPQPRGTCPPGATARSDHAGEWCDPDDCAADSECQPGYACRERPLCLETRAVVGGRVPGSSSASAYTHRVAVGTCEAGGSCASPAECSASSKRCVKTGLVERARASCGCALFGADTAAGSSGLAAALALGAFVARRRARRPRAL